jgi:hypothetical protein
LTPAEYTGVKGKGSWTNQSDSDGQRCDPQNNETRKHETVRSSHSEEVIRGQAESNDQTYDRRDYAQQKAQTRGKRNRGDKRRI